MPSWVQTGYEVEVIRAGRTQTFRVDSNESVLVPWPDKPLQSREAAGVRVRSFGKQTTNNGTTTESEWSAPATVEAALLEDSQWEASFITSASRIGPEGPLQPLRFRKRFSLPDGFRDATRARLYVTAKGVFQPYVNGELASDELMAPGWTSYSHRLNYRILDVTELLGPGKENVLAVEAAEGWYSGRLGFLGGKRFWYGKDIAVMAQLEVTSKDGDVWKLCSDDTWSCAASALQSSEIYDGEVYDAAKEDHSWKTASDNSSFASTKVLPRPKTQVTAADAPPVRVTEEVKAVELIKTPSGKTVIDFGQNLVGKVLIRSLKGAVGHKVTLAHAEVMEHGELGTRPLRFAKQTDTIICNGEELKDWSVRFTFHGFRYVQIDGWPAGAGELQLSNFAALVMHTDMERTGHFECSNPWLNKLHLNTVWSMRGNFLSIPTDCPQRDERLGWTGDIQVFTPSASFLYNTSGMLGEWCQDLMAEQLEEHRGGVPALVCPDVLPSKWPQTTPQAVWDDAVVLVPWVLYQYSNDVAMLERQFPSMDAWLRTGVRRGSDGLWDSDLWQLSDWLDPTAPPEDPGLSRTDGTLVADAYLVHVTEVVGQVCEILKKEDLRAHYLGEAKRLKRLFQDKYISPYGNLMSNTQTALSLAIQFGLYSDEKTLQTAKEALRKQVRYAKFKIMTGFAGTPVVTHALAKAGYPQLAYRMLLEKGCPSWLYPVSMGATTIWERWNSMMPDGTINPGEMTSFNHYALGSVVDFLHQTVGGIGAAGPGWKTIKIAPVPGGNVTSAKASYKSPYGLVRCEWKTADNRFIMDVEVPANCKALVTLPSSQVGEVQEVASGIHHFECEYLAVEWPPTSLKPIHAPKDEDLSMIAS